MLIIQQGILSGLIMWDFDFDFDPWWCSLVLRHWVADDTFRINQSGNCRCGCD